MGVPVFPNRIGHEVIHVSQHTIHVVLNLHQSKSASWSASVPAAPCLLEYLSHTCQTLHSKVEACLYDFIWLCGQCAVRTALQRCPSKLILPSRKQGQGEPQVLCCTETCWVSVRAQLVHGSAQHISLLVVISIVSQGKYMCMYSNHVHNVCQRRLANLYRGH